MKSAIRNEMARSSFGSSARASAGGRRLDFGFGVKVVILRAPSSSGGVLVRAEVVSPAPRNGSGGEKERVACGNTVLLNRSLAGFLTARAGGGAAAGSLVTGAERPVSFLKRSRNGIVILINGPPPLLPRLLRGWSRLRALSQLPPSAKFSFPR